MTIMYATVAVIAFTGGIVCGTTAPAAHADAGYPNCQTDVVHRGLLGLQAQQRTICDSPVRPDGSWQRARVFWIPAHHVSAQSNCYSGSYSSHCTFTDAYDVDDTVVDQNSYVVFPDNVLPDEPGHLPA